MNRTHFLSATFLTVGILLSSMFANAQNRNDRDNHNNPSNKYQHQGNQNGYNNDARYAHKHHHRANMRCNICSAPRIVRPHNSCAPVPRRVARRIISNPLVFMAPAPRRMHHNRRW